VGYPGCRTMVMAPSHNVVESQRSHIVNSCLSGIHHHFSQIFIKFGITIKGTLQPLLGYFLRCKRVVPCETTKTIPIGLGKNMPRPVYICANVGNTRDPAYFMAIYGTIHHF